MKIVALVQARMGSTRLPGKILMDIEGESMLWHVSDRLRRAKLLGGMIIVTSVSGSDDPVENFCKHENIDFFRGSENDVLDRYYHAATHFKIDQIVRITGDCPLIDPEVVDAVIQKHLSSGADYTSNTLNRTYPRGLDVEIFTFACLQAAYGQADQPFEREHVTPFIYQHAELFRLVSVEADPTLCGPDIRICVDMPEDLMLIRKICRELKGSAMGIGEIVRLFERKPELLKINAGIQQKKAI
ncbi:MAG: glycosyltransferase family protein [Candidatus Omnitrophota bacterium]